MSVASNLVYLTATGQTRFEGGAWGDIFAAAINAEHLNSPLGIVDVALGDTAWSAKTVGQPISRDPVRLISGRNDVQYSFGNTAPLLDPQETGSQVLQIWNARVEAAAQRYSHLRVVVLVRDTPILEYMIFEYIPVQFDPADYVWAPNRSGRNLEGRTVNGNIHTFTWQSGGGQFTILRPASGSARSFAIRPPQPIIRINPQGVLDTVGYSDDWVEFL